MSEESNKESRDEATQRRIEELYTRRYVEADERYFALNPSSDWMPVEITNPAL